MKVRAPVDSPDADKQAAERGDIRFVWPTDFLPTGKRAAISELGRAYTKTDHKGKKTRFAAHAFVSAELANISAEETMPAIHQNGINN